MKLSAIILILIALYFHDKNQRNDIVKVNNIKPEFNEDFHEDFDSTYYYYGCKYNTFKLNHKCNGQIQK